MCLNQDTQYVKIRTYVFYLDRVTQCAHFQLAFDREIVDVLRPVNREGSYQGETNMYSFLPEVGF